MITKILNQQELTKNTNFLNNQNYVLSDLRKEKILLYLNRNYKLFSDTSKFNILEINRDNKFNSIYYYLFLIYFFTIMIKNDLLFLGIYLIGLLFIRYKFSNIYLKNSYNIYINNDKIISIKKNIRV